MYKGFSKCLILLLIIQTFNLSINSNAFYGVIYAQLSHSVDLDLVDSLAEYLVENVMGFSKDTFHDKATSHTATKPQHVVHFDLKWFSSPVIKYKHSKSGNDKTFLYVQNDRIRNLYFKEVPAKPPQNLSVAA